MPISPAQIVLFIFLFWVLVQTFYYLFFFSRLAFYKSAADSSFAQHDLPVSIVVCAFNEEENLKQNLPNILNQVYVKDGKPNFEVVVVNDNSEDNSFYLLNEMKKVYPHLHVVNLTQNAKLIPGKKFPLSMGIKSAKYDHLLLTDADCVPSSEVWLAKMVAGFSDSKKIVLGYAPYFKHAGWLNKKIRFETVHAAIQYMSFALAKRPYMGVGRNLAYHRNLFNANKGFSSHHHIVSGDDDLFINQVANAENVLVELNQDTFVFSEPKKTSEDWNYQKRRHLSTGKYYKTTHKMWLGLYAMSHFFTWIGFFTCFFFPSIIIWACCGFVFRWLIQWYIFQRSCEKLNEKDLINYIWVFDFWLLFYNLKSVPSIFLKQKIHWK